MRLDAMDAMRYFIEFITEHQSDYKEANVSKLVLA
jgi:hypothetical protein